MFSSRSFFYKLTLFLVLLFGSVSAGNAPAVGDALNKIKYKHELAACAIFQNEDRFLKEWLDFHLVVGVQHFYLFNNLSSDNYRAILDPYIQAGIVELIDWPYPSDNVVEWNTIQCNAYKKAVALAKGTCRWLAVLDTDEYLIPVSGIDLKPLLEPYRKFGGLCVNWQMYGTSHVAKIETGKLLIEMLMMKAPPDYGENIHVKSIVQPMRVVDCTNPHMFIYKKGYFSVNASKQRCPGPFNEPISIDKFRINHYWARDEDFLFNIKIPRNVKWGGNVDNILERVNIMNQVYDPIMLEFVEGIKALYM